MSLFVTSFMLCSPERRIHICSFWCLFGRLPPPRGAWVWGSHYKVGNLGIIEADWPANRWLYLWTIIEAVARSCFFPATDLPLDGGGVQGLSRFIEGIRSGWFDRRSRSYKARVSLCSWVSFTWLVIRRALWLDKSLHSAGLEKSPNCVCCRNVMATLEYALFHYRLVIPLYRFIEDIMVRIIVFSLKPVMSLAMWYRCVLLFARWYESRDMNDTTGGILWGREAFLFPTNLVLLTSA